MSLRFVTRTIHAYLDYPVALALMGLPFLLGLGASNPVPPALLGKPAVVGPDHVNFGEMVDALSAAGALHVCDDPWTGLKEILDDAARRTRMANAGPAAVARHRGATERIVALIREMLRGTGSPTLG